MGGYTPKCAVTKLGIRESRLALKDTLNHNNQDVHSCNRIGCSTTRLGCLKASKAATSDKAKNLKPSFPSASGKSITASCSETYSSTRDTKNHHKEPQHPSLKEATLSSKVSKFQTASIFSATSSQTELSETDDVDFGVLKDTSVNIPQEVGESSNTKTQMHIHRQSSMRNQNTPSGSLKLSSASSKVSQANTTSHGRAGIRKLGSTSVSDSLSLGTCSSSRLSKSRRDHAVKKKSDGECSTSGKTMTGGQISSSRGTSSSSSRLPRFGCPSTEQASNKRRTLSKVDVASVSSKKVMPKGERTSLLQPKGVIQRDLAIHVRPPSLQASSTIRQNSLYSRAARYNETLDSRRARDIEEDTVANPVHGLSSNPDPFRHISTDGFAEVLLALERIEQDEDLTYEQRLVLESNLFLDGLGFLDHHRDMRMDIENMSYEELLDLEEKMGTVSTALTEEALSKCLKKSFYTCLDPTSKSRGDDDHVKCSICQEEFGGGDEVGKLGCEHGYHIMCIYQWLRQKNWCPVCKSPAASSTS